MVVIKDAFHLNVVCYALNYLIQHGEIENDIEREMMAQANVLLHKYRKELEEIRKYRKSLQ